MMDLSEKCHHCNANPGEICSYDCSVNGKLLKKLDEIAAKLNLRREGFNLVSVYPNKQKEM